MADQLGPILVPDPPVIPAFPLQAMYGSGLDFTPPIAIHSFDQPGLKTEQRYLLGSGTRRFRIVRDHLSCTEYDDLKAHFEEAQASYAQFPYTHPTPGGDITVTARYENPNLAFPHLVGMLTSDPGVTLLEVPTIAPSYASTATVTRFPDDPLTTALANQVQQMIPLVTISSRELQSLPIASIVRVSNVVTVTTTTNHNLATGWSIRIAGVTDTGFNGSFVIATVPTATTITYSHPGGNTSDSTGTAAPFVQLHLSNQRCTVNGQLYLPRLLDWNGISQTIGEASDSAQFTFGNADDVFTKLGNSVNLLRAGIQFSLFHVNSNYLIQLWGGYARPWSMDSSGQFVLPASDGVFQLGLAYPARQLSRTCWKVYRGRFCPASASNGFPDCPKDYAACVARGVPKSFGGVVALPQSVRIKDNSTGVFGFGRSQFTSVSIADDSVYDRAIQEVYTDEAMLVTCDVAAGRDESDFYSALGIVGEGPIGKYDQNLLRHTLDGQPPHDPLRNGGWRGIVGNDPAGDLDYFLLDQAPWVQRIKGWIPTVAGLPLSGNQTGDGWITEDTVHLYVWDDAWFDNGALTYAAGLAFAEIRRTDAKGLQLSAVSDRAMSVTVDQGIGGWTWTAPGARVFTPGLSNTVWVAVNVYLRAIGLRVDQPREAAISPAEMEMYFDVNQAIAAAAICDLQVPSMIVPTQNERQFPFRGVLKEKKPLKDWLTEILNCCLGYYTFVNGKLWIGIRYHSGAPSAYQFTRDQTLYKSLTATPINPQFNWLLGQFGDEEFNWALNTVGVYDMDAATLAGNGDSPQYTQNTMTFVGVSNKSQCARIVTTRLREELGGVGPAEQLAARNFNFRTTLLALQIMAGDIVAMNSPRLPNGYCEGRVQSWVLNPDFSIDIQCSCTTDSMYALDSGPKPADGPAAPVIPEQLPAITGLAWMPNEVGPSPGDPVYQPWERTFDLWQEYEITRDGVWQPTIWVKGQMAVNRFVTQVQPRILEIKFASGGNLTGPMVVYAAVTQGDADGEPAVPSNLSAIYIPQGVSGQKVTLTVVGATDAILTRYDVWAGVDRRRMAFQFGSPGQPPGTINIPGPIVDNTQGLPEGAAVGLRIAAKHVWHAGIAGLLVNKVIGANQIVCNDFLNSGDAWVGQIAFVCSNVDGDVPLWNFKITAFDPASATLTVTPDCTGVQAGDVLIMYSAPTALEAGLGAGWTAQNSITNSLWNNSVNRQQFPGTAGMTPGEEKGRIVRILRGTGAGQWRFVTDNTQLTHQIAPAWDVIPDSTSLYIVEAPDWPSISPTNQLIVPHFGLTTAMHLEVPNLTEEVALVGGFLVDTEGHQTDDEVATYRMIYVFGQPPTVRICGPDPGPFDIAVTDQTIRCDTSQTDVTLTLPKLADYQGRNLLILNEGPGSTIINTTPPDTFPGGTSNQFTITAPGGTIRITAGGIYTT